MPRAGLVGGFGHPAMQELASAADDVVPLERRTRVHFIRLDVEMSDVDRIQTSPGLGIGGLNLLVTLRDGTVWTFFMGQRSIVEGYLESRALVR